MVYSAGAGGGVGARRSCSAPSALISLVRAVDSAECEAADDAECDAANAAEECKAIGCLVIVYQVEDR